MLVKTKLKKTNKVTKTTTKPEKTEIENSSLPKISTPKPDKHFYTGLGVAYALIAILLCLTYTLSKRVKAVEANATVMEEKLAQRVDSNRKIYVYNMEETLRIVGIVESSQKFETDIASLEKEVQDAQEKIKTLKEAKVKEEFSDMYLRSLRMRRDELINKYSESMQVALNAINQALEDVARENNVHTIFMSSALAITTDYVVDVTPQVVERVKQQTANISSGK